MLIIKNISTLTVTVFFVSVWAQSNDFSMGERVTGDSLLSQNPVEAPKKFWPWEKTSLTKYFYVANNKKITKFEAVDRRNDGKNAYVTLQGGGVGYTFLYLGFESKGNNGIHFMVNLYGR